MVLTSSDYVNNNEKVEKEFFESYYYIFGWFLTAVIGMLYFTTRGQIDMGTGFMLGSILSMFAIFALGTFVTFEKAYIKKFGHQF